MHNINTTLYYILYSLYYVNTNVHGIYVMYVGFKFV